MSLRIPPWLAIIAAWLLINTAISFHNIWPTPWITVRPELSVEAAFAVLFVIFASRRDRLTGPVAACLTAAIMLLAAGRYMEVTAPALYGRAINLYWDARHLPAVVAMIADGASPWTLLAGGSAIALGVAAIYLALRRAVLTIGAAQSQRPLIGWLCVGVICTYMLGYLASFGPILRWYAIPVTQTYLRQIEFIAQAMAGSGAAEQLPHADPLSEWHWSRPATPADVFVVFVESYGAVAYDADEVAAEVEPHRADFAAAVAAAGGEIASAFVTSPTFGGVSWLAHSSFMTGIDVTDSGVYNALLTQQRETLADRFDMAGFRTVALMPGLRGDWPEGSFYGFDRIYGERDIDYGGPEFGWWRIPDQFALARFGAAELDQPQRPPVLLFFPTINTHMPFRPTPPYQPNWQKLLGPSPFEPTMLDGMITSRPSLTDLRPAYADALSYTFDYLGGFLGQRADRDWLLLVLGDHQPPASVAGAQARWDVPVHGAASDRNFLEPFVARGFVHGSKPAPSPVARTHELGGALLEALGATHDSH
jgi:hypothetical protein